MTIPKNTVWIIKGRSVSLAECEKASILIKFKTVKSTNKATKQPFAHFFTFILPRIFNQYSSMNSLCEYRPEKLIALSG